MKTEEKKEGVKITAKMPMSTSAKSSLIIGAIIVAFIMIIVIIINADTEKNTEKNTVANNAPQLQLDSKYWFDVADTSWYKPNESSLTISTPEQLAGLAKLVNVISMDKNYRFSTYNPVDFKEKTIILTNNINLAGKEWTPIGRMEPMGSHATHKPTFLGTFDGGGYTISNMTIEECTDYYIGLFGTASGPDAVIKSVNITDAMIEASGKNAGGIVGSISSVMVYDCTFSGSINNIGTNTGGIVGDMGKGTVMKCTSNARVIGAPSSSDFFQFCVVGGIVGGIGNGEVKNCTSNGSVIGNGGSNTFVGGVIGNSRNSTISYCASNNDITYNNSSNFEGGGIGGIVGRTENDTVYSCTSSGNISCYNARTGGIVGDNKYSIVKDCKKLNGKISSMRRVGGIIGTDMGGEIINNTFSMAATEQKWGMGGDYITGSTSNKGCIPLP